MAWSGGKDSALALHVLRAAGTPVAGLLTTLSAAHQRVSMHGVRREVLELQARAVGLPLDVVELPAPCSDADYAERMEAALAPWRARGVATVAFGDLFLEDLRRWREERLAAAGWKARFPLWGRDTALLPRELLDLGYRATVVCVDGRLLSAAHAGMSYDEAFLASLPPGVDPCGENGEFHSLVVAGPLLSRPLELDQGERVERDGFHYVDLVPRGAPQGRDGVSDGTRTPDPQDHNLVL